MCLSSVQHALQQSAVRSAESLALPNELPVTAHLRQFSALTAFLSAEADRLPRQHAHGVLQQESGARTYLAAAGEAAATNVGAPWNFVAGIANDAGNYIMDRWRSLQSGDESQGQSEPSTVRCVQRCR